MAPGRIGSSITDDGTNRSLTNSGHKQRAVLPLTQAVKRMMDDG